MCLLKLYLVTRDKRIDKYHITGKHNPSRPTSTYNVDSWIAQPLTATLQL